jgi:hypothetical protein
MTPYPDGSHTPQQLSAARDAKERAMFAIEDATRMQTSSTGLMFDLEDVATVGYKTYHMQLF